MIDIRSGASRRLARVTCAAAAGLFCAASVCAQTTAEEQPLSVIDWLGTQMAPTVESAPGPKPPVNEPPVTQSALPPQVSVAPLTGRSPRAIGLVPPAITGLDADLWRGSEVDRLTRLLDRLPDPQLPAAQSLLYTVLLAEGLSPQGDEDAGDALALARVDKLVELGALDPALALIEQTGVTTSSDHFDLWMDISLLTGTEDRACRVLSTSPHLTRSYGTRIFCAARDSAWDNAALTFGSAQALNLLPPEKLALLDRFLHPEEFEGAAPLPAMRDMDPLSFRLFETIGEAMPTRNLPRAFAVADLRDVAGWKAQLEAADRLPRSGALPDNRLLGLYTDRAPAASGGIWDRVQALQRFETALETESAEAVTKTLPPAWSAMKQAGLEVAFASLFAERLSAIPVTGSAASDVFEICLLSPAYETAAQDASKSGEGNALLRAVAQGEASDQRPGEALPGAIHDAFSGAEPRMDILQMSREQRLGEAILLTLEMLDNGARGDTMALRSSLATLRALGLEDTARRAALQTLVLDR